MYSSAINENTDDYGNVWSRDYGPLQVNDSYHAEEMRKQGKDITNQFHSLEYGLELMKQEGTKPWNASRKCWQG